MTLWFAEIYDKINSANDRVFDIYFENNLLIDDLDIFDETGKIDEAYYVTRTVEVRDGALSIKLQSVIQNCKLNGIEIKADGTVSPHFAHAVPHPTAGSYFAIASQGTNSATFQVDGTDSHTHQPGKILTRWTWSVQGLGNVGNGETPKITLPVGTWQLNLEVEDSGGDIESDFCVATVRAYGYPELSTVTPDVADVGGGDKLTIIGQFLSNVQTVKIGSKLLTGAAIKVVNAQTVEITSPLAGQPETVQISVITPLGESNSIPFTYIDEALPPVKWITADLLELQGPTTVAFDHLGRLYIGTQLGEVVRLTLDDNFNIVNQIVSDAVQNSEPSFRVILGIAIDPDDHT